VVMVRAARGTTGYHQVLLTRGGHSRRIFSP